MLNSEKYTPADQPCFFLTLNTVDCIDIFIRPVYKQIIVHSLNYFIDHKGLNVYAWCLMTNHLHLLVQARDNCVIADIEKEYKLFTTKKILEDIETEPEARRKWMMDHFESVSNVFGLMKKFHVWQANSNPVLIDVNKRDALIEHIEHIHYYPIRDRIVDSAPDYLYSSARDYAGMRGLVRITRLPYLDQQVISSDTRSNFYGKFVRN